MAGGAVAGALACPLYGDHAEWLDPMLPWGDKNHDKNTEMHSAVGLRMSPKGHIHCVASVSYSGGPHDCQMA